MKVAFLDLAAAHEQVRGELDAAYERVVRSGRFILGDELAAFESEFAAYCGARHCFGVANGLEALELILRAFGVRNGDEVIVPAHTFIATWLAVSNVGATPIAVEPDETLNIDVARVAAAISPRTKAIIVVHLYGQPADVDALRELAASRGIALIEDAAQAHGSRYKKRAAGSLADAAGWSFYPGKNLGALGDGGAITTDRDDLAARIRLLRNYGSNKKYYHDVKGTNSRLDELQAAFLRVKLRHLDRWNARRREVASLYRASLGNAAGLGMPIVRPWAEPSWHLFVVRHPQRDELQRRLASRGVETLVHYPIPPHRSPAYAEMSHLSLPLTERASAEVLSIPMGPHLSEAEVGHVCDSITAECAQLAEMTAAGSR